MAVCWLASNFCYYIKSFPNTFLILVDEIKWDGSWRVRATQLGECPQVWRVLACRHGECRRVWWVTISTRNALQTRPRVLATFAKFALAKFSVEWPLLRWDTCLLYFCSCLDAKKRKIIIKSRKYFNENDVT